MSIHLTHVVAPGSGGAPRGAPHGRPLAIWGDRARLIICVRGETHQNARFQPNVAPVRPPIGNATSRGHRGGRILGGRHDESYVDRAMLAA